MPVTLSKTRENEAKINALKLVPNTKWSGTTTHDTMDKCLRVLCLFCGVNSGHYNPVCVRINRVPGFFMVNEDGSLFCEARVIKESDKLFRIEHMTNSAWDKFENDYLNYLEGN